jgi:hypothetical protein
MAYPCSKLPECVGMCIPVPAYTRGVPDAVFAENIRQLEGRGDFEELRGRVGENSPLLRTLTHKK